MLNVKQVRCDKSKILAGGPIWGRRFVVSDQDNHGYYRCTGYSGYTADSSPAVKILQ